MKDEELNNNDKIHVYCYAYTFIIEIKATT